MANTEGVRGYAYEIGQCDVADENKPALAEFREKRIKWIGWLEADKPHSIWTQITTMMWFDAAYRTILEAREYASATTPTAAINRMIGHMIDMGHFQTQVLALCRLTDPSDPKKPERGIVSVRRLLGDMVAHRRLLTRENCVCYDGLPFDSAAAQAEYYQQHGHQTNGEFRRLPTTGPEAFFASERAHGAFDRISGKTESNRSRGDLVDERVFRTIGAWLDDPVFSWAITLRHKFIAHAADEFSRAQAPLERPRDELDEFAKAQELIVRAAHALGIGILYDSFHAGVVPVPQFNQFEHLDLPLTPADRIRALREWWHEHEEARKQWVHKKFDLLTGSEL